MATTPIQQRIADFRAQDRVQAGSLITTLFGDAVIPRGGRIWLGSLIRLLEPLGVNERLVRTAVAPHQACSRRSCGGTSACCCTV